jgi:hypothetical protein
MKRTKVTDWPMVTANVNPTTLERIEADSEGSRPLRAIARPPGPRQRVPPQGPLTLRGLTYLPEL